jgi:glycosyltransferase involved in cell wall biosynthesis
MCSLVTQALGVEKCLMPENDRTVLTRKVYMEPRPLILIDTGIIGGPGRGIIQLVSFLGAKGVEYLICTFKYRSPRSNEFIDELRRLKLSATTIGQAAIWDPSPIMQFFRLVKRGRYNVVQSHGYKSHLVALVVSRLAGIPWIAFAHGWTKEDQKVRLYHALDMWMLRFAESVVVVSKPLLSSFATMRGEARPTTLILNAVDREGLVGSVGGGEIRRKYLVNKSGFLIGCFGRLSFEKGQDILLRSVERVSRDVPGVSFLFLGDGPEREALERLSRELGLGEKVVFIPHTYAMRDYYEAIDLLVLPSRSEGLPNVILEALAFGVPVIATDVGAVREVIVDEVTGWIVAPGDSEGLARTISKVASNGEERERVADAGRMALSEKFSPVTRGQRILGMYQKLLNQ